MKALKYVGRREGISTYETGPHYLHGQNKAAVLKLLTEKKANEVFYVSETYSQVTPESAEHGDFSETGYEDYGSFYTLKDLLKRISDGGFNEGSVAGGTRADLYQSDSNMICYKTCTTEQNCLHITGSKLNMERLARILNTEKS